jgi:hypothetical protein
MFGVGIVDGVAKMIQSATGNAKLSMLLESTCKQMVKIIEEERKAQAQ